MNITMKLLAIFVVACLACPALHAKKNYFRIPFRSAPVSFEELMTAKDIQWNFNFRPYSKESAALLFTDPAFQRDVSSGKNIEGVRPTAMTFMCDSAGFTVFVFAGEPEFAKNLAEGKPLPKCMLEMFFAPGDCDSGKIEHYNQFIIDEPSTNKVNHYPWLVDSRGFEPLEEYLRLETKMLPNGYMLRIFVPWEFTWSRLPFSDGPNNIWRLSILRFSPGGGQSWGGVVHELSRAGYIAWPEFTNEQKTAIRQNVLMKAWLKYKTVLASVDPAKTPDLKEPYREKSMSAKRSFNNIAENRDFTEKHLAPMIAERNSLGEKIATLNKMNQDEQTAFYDEAVAKLMNFDYDIEDSFAAYLKNKIMND